MWCICFHFLMTHCSCDNMFPLPYDTLLMWNFCFHFLHTFKKTFIVTLPLLFDIVYIPQTLPYDPMCKSFPMRFMEVALDISEFPFIYFPMYYQGVRGKKGTFPHMDKTCDQLGCQCPVLPLPLSLSLCDGDVLSCPFFSAIAFAQLRVGSVSEALPKALKPNSETLVTLPLKNILFAYLKPYNISV